MKDEDIAWCFKKFVLQQILQRLRFSTFILHPLPECPWRMKTKQAFAAGIGAF